MHFVIMNMNYFGRVCLRTIGRDGKPIWSDVPRNWKRFKSAKDAEAFGNEHGIDWEMAAPGFIDG